LEVYIKIVTDYYATIDGNKFVITDSRSGETVKSELLDQDSSIMFFNYCLPKYEDSCYEFTLTDNYGDGLGSKGSIFITVDDNTVSDVQGNTFTNELEISLACIPKLN
jgi:hypothetical protein